MLLQAKMLKNEVFLALKLLDVVFILLINVKMPTIGILTFMSRINFMLSLVELKKVLYYWGQDCFEVSDTK